MWFHHTTWIVRTPRPGKIGEKRIVAVLGKRLDCRIPSAFVLNA